MASTDSRLTWGFALLTVGSLMWLAAVRNTSIVGVLEGTVTGTEPGPGEKGFTSFTIGDAATSVLASVTEGAGAGAGVAATMVPGLSTWTNPDGGKVRIAKWIYLELKRVKWHGYIESGYRSKQDQERVCATGVQPCATPGTSNHEGKKFPKGAIDVRQSEAAELDAKLRAANSKLQYAGAKDPVHFSYPHNGSY